MMSVNWSRTTKREEKMRQSGKYKFVDLPNEVPKLSESADTGVMD